MSKIYIKNRYGQIPNDILNNKELSFKAKGLWGYIQSKPDGWDFAVSRITNDTLDGKDGVTAGLKELEDCGLLIRMKYKNEEGKFETNYILQERANLSMTEKPETEIPESENPEIYKERYNKERIINNNTGNLIGKNKTQPTIPANDLNKSAEKNNRTMLTIVNDYETSGKFILEELIPANALEEYEEDSLMKLANIFLSYYVENKDKISKAKANVRARFNKFIISDYHKVLVKKAKWPGLDTVTDEEFIELLRMGYLKSSQCPLYINTISKELDTEAKKRLFSAMIRFFTNKHIEAYKSVTFKEFAIKNGYLF